LPGRDENADDVTQARPEAKLPAARWLRLLVGLQYLALVGYVLLHSPLMPTLARMAGVHQPDFCYFVCP
jgi:hypothetical protein